MGLKEDPTSRGGLIASIRDVYVKQFIFLRNLSTAVVDRFAADGAKALERSFWKFGHWRGQYIRSRPETIVEGRDAASLLRNWDSIDFAIAQLEGAVTAQGNAEEARATLAAVPGTDYFRTRDGGGILQPYWSRLLSGIAAGYDEDATVEWRPGDHGPSLTVRWKRSVATRGSRVEGFPDILTTPAVAIQLVRRAAQNNGALYMFVAREVIDAFDASGEQAIREGVRGIGRERGSALRERHVAEGKPLNLETLMTDWDGPLVSVWIFKDEGYLSPSTWHQDCTWCPYADVWAELGSEGLALGYLYDMELHTSQFQTYLPGVRIEWDALKTRGDAVCKFRFSVPGLVQPGEPRYVRRGAGQTGETPSPPVSPP